LIAAVLLALGPGGEAGWAQADLATIRSRAEQGDPEALNALGNAHANGAGVPQDFAGALRLYQRAADRGLAAASFNLGMMHELGRGVEPSPDAAFRHYMKAAEHGFAPAQFNVGNMYASGTGTNQDYFEAALWFRQAADRGVSEAQYNLALAYELGRGVGRDEPAALRWYRLAAAQGYARAQYNLALMLEEGRGAPVDAAAALELYRAAALQNFAPAQNNLGILLAEGRGTPADLIDAYTWLAIAVENGARPTGRDIVARQLSSAQLGQANLKIALLRTQLGMRDQPVATVASSALPPAATAPVLPSIGAGQSAEGAAVHARLVKAEAEAERFRRENARLADSARELGREKAALEERLARNDAETARAGQIAREQLVRQIAILQAAMNEVRQNYERLEAENAALRAASGGAAAGDSVAAHLSALPLSQLATSDARIAKLMSDNARLNEEVKRSTVELSQLGRQLRNAQEKLDRAVSDAASASGQPEKLAEVTQQLERLRHENQQLRSASTELSELVSQRDALVAEKSALEKKLAGDAQAASGGREMVEQLTAQLDAAGRSIAALNAKSDSLQKDLEVARQSAAAALAAQATAAQAASSEAMKLELQTLQNHVRRLETQGEEDRRNAARELSALASQLANSRESNRALSSANRSLLQARGSEEAETKSEIEELRSRLAISEEKLEKTRVAQVALQAQLAEATKGSQQHGATVAELTGLNEKLTAEKAALEEQLGQWREDLDRTRAGFAELESRANSADAVAQQQIATIRELTAANERLQGQAHDATGQLEMLREENVRLATSGENAAAMRTEVAELRSRLSDAQRSGEMQAASVAELTDTNDRLSSELKELQAQLADLRSANARYVQGDIARQEAERRAASLEATAAQLGSSQRDLTVARGEIGRLSGIVQALERDRAAQIAQLQQENAAVAARLRQAQGTLEQIASAARLMNQGSGASTLMPPPPDAIAGTPTAPAGNAVPVSPRYYVVAEGDTLTRISARYYGTSSRWQEIYEANREVLRAENSLRLGQRLRIP
jgi:TPR repeat protein/nucleoid-associated protein YgaU